MFLGDQGLPLQIVSLGFPTVILIPFCGLPLLAVFLERSRPLSWEAT